MGLINAILGINDVCDPTSEAIRVFVLRDGVVYEGDNTIVEKVKSNGLSNLIETNYVLTENKVSVDDILAEIAKGVVYQSTDTNSDKTESYLFKKLVTDNRFGKLVLPELDDSQFGLSDLETLGNILFVLVNRGELPPEASEKIKESCRCPADVQAAFWIGRKEKDANRLLTAWFTVRKLCEKLKAAKESKQATKPAAPSVTPAPVETDKS